MKTILITIVLSITISAICVSQSYTEKYNSIYKRYEYYDSNGKLVGYKKWNPIYKRYDIKFTGGKNKDNSKKYSGYIQPYDLDLLERTLRYKQNQYYKRQHLVRNNRELIQNKLDYIASLYKYLQNNRATLFNNIYENIAYGYRIKKVKLLVDNYLSYVNNLNRSSYNSGSNSVISRIMSDLDRHEKMVLSFTDEIKREVESEVRQISEVETFYQSLNTYPSSIKCGYHKVYCTDGKSFLKERKVQVENNRVVKYIVENTANSISISNNINKGKTQVKVTGGRGFITIYFLNYITNSKN